MDSSHKLTESERMLWSDAQMMAVKVGHETVWVSCCSLWVNYPVDISTTAISVCATYRIKPSWEASIQLTWYPSNHDLEPVHSDSKYTWYVVVCLLACMLWLLHANSLNKEYFLHTGIVFWALCSCHGSYGFCYDFWHFNRSCASLSLLQLKIYESI